MQTRVFLHCAYYKKKNITYTIFVNQLLAAGYHLTIPLKKKIKKPKTPASN